MQIIIQQLHVNDIEEQNKTKQNKIKKKNKNYCNWIWIC